MSIFKINFKVLIFSEFVRNSFDSDSWTYIGEERVAHLRYEDLISGIDEGNKDIKKAHIDAMVDKDFRWVDRDFRFIE